MSVAEVRQWLADRATVLESLTPDTETRTDDLALVDRLVGGARVVGLGLAVPGSRELTTLAHRLLAHLVREHGVRRLALVAGESAVPAVDAHARPGVSTHGDGLGDALRLLQPWSWATREMVAVVRWLADHNEAAAPGDRVEVVGVDPRHPAAAVSALGRYLRAAAPELLAEVRDPLADLLMARGAVTGRDLGPAVDEILAVLDRDEAQLVAATSPEEHAAARRHAHRLRRSALLAAAPREEADGVWARLMADAVLEGTAGRSEVPTVLWGPAGHLRTPEAPAVLGSHLRMELGEGYRAVLLTTGTGQVRALRRRRLLGAARRPSTNRLRPPAAGMLEADLAPEPQVVDLRGPAADADAAPGDGALPDAVARWASSACRHRAVDDRGSLAAPGPTGAAATASVVPARELDGVAYVPRTRPVSDL